LARRKDQRKDPAANMVKLSSDAPVLEKLEWEKQRALSLIVEEQKKARSCYAKPLEYRCSRCRFSPSGVGCDGKYCNPYKWLEKVERLKKAAQEAKEAKKSDDEIAATEAKVRKALSEGSRTHEEKMKEYNMPGSASGGGEINDRE